MRTTTLVSLLTAATLMVGCGGGGSSSSDAGNGTVQTSGYSTWDYVTTKASAKRGYYSDNKYSSLPEGKEPSQYLQSAVYDHWDTGYSVISESDHVGYREAGNVDDTYMLTKKEESVEFRNIVSIGAHGVLYFFPDDPYDSPAHNFPRVVSVGDTFDTFDRKRYPFPEETSLWDEVKGECTLKEHSNNYKGKGEALVFECISHFWEQAHLSTDLKDVDYTVDNTYVFVKGMGLYEIDELGYDNRGFVSYITTFENE